MRPALEVADILRRHGAAYRADQTGSLTAGQRHVMAAIELCRTAALGGHVECCEDCGDIRIAYNSCLMGKAGNAGESGPSLRWGRVFHPYKRVFHSARQEADSAKHEESARASLIEG